MANWYGATRTNYFTVTDEERYSVLFSCLQGDEDSVEDFTKTENGKIDNFLWEISKILSPDSAFVIHTIGNEKLRYLTSDMAIVFPGKAPIWKSMNELAIKICQEELGNDFKLNIEY